MPIFRVKLDNGKTLKFTIEGDASREELQSLVDDYLENNKGGPTKEQLINQNMLNRQAEADQAVSNVKNIGHAVAEVPRLVGGMFGGTPVAGSALMALGETAGQGIDIASGGRESFDPTEIGEQAAVPVITAGIGKGIKAAAPLIKESAQKSVARIFHPTRLTEKYLVEQKIAPEFLERNMLPVTRQGLEERAINKSQKAATELENYYDSLPPDTQINIRPIIDSLEDVKSKLYISSNGAKVIAGDLEKQAAKQIEKMQLKLAQLASVPNQVRLTIAGTGSQSKLVPILNDVSLESLRSLRQKLDSTVAKAGGYAGKSLKVQDKLWARREAANSIRREIANQHPDLQKLNAEFTFWQNVEDVIGITNNRTQAQSAPLTKQLFRMGAGITGASQGGIEGGIIGYASAEALVRAFQSTAWRAVSANGKNMVANLISSGNMDRAAKVATNLILGKVGRIINEESENTNTFQ